MASYLNPFSWSFQINKALLPLPASSNISIHLHTNTCRLISAHVFIKTHVLTHFHTYLHTIIFTHKYILSGSFISMRITNLTTVALNLHVNDDYFGCFRLFLQIRAFILFQSRLLLYIIYVWAYLRYVRFLPCQLQKPCHFLISFVIWCLILKLPRWSAFDNMLNLYRSKLL